MSQIEDVARLLLPAMRGLGLNPAGLTLQPATVVGYDSDPRANVVRVLPDHASQSHTAINLADAALTAGQRVMLVSLADGGALVLGPLTMGGAIAFAPAPKAGATAWTAGTGSIEGWYVLASGMVDFEIALEWATGSSWGAGTGTVSFQLPFPYAGTGLWGNAHHPVGHWSIVDQATARYVGTALITDDSGGGQALVLADSPALTTGVSLVTHNSPIATWAATDGIRVVGRYRADLNL